IADATACDITERHIKPLFRAGNYEAGLATGIDLICKAIRGEYKGSGKTVAERQSGGGVFSLFPFITFIIALIIISRVVRKFGGYNYSSRGGGPVFIPVGGGWSSGGGGGGGGGIQRLQRRRWELRRGWSGIELVRRCERENS